MSDVWNINDVYVEYAYHYWSELLMYIDKSLIDYVLLL